MGIFETFKRDAACDKCGRVFPKRTLNALDSTLSDQRPRGEVLWLCRSCLVPELQSGFSAYQKRAIVVYPLGGKWNAYQFYTFPLMLKEYGFEKEWVEAVKTFLPPVRAKCQTCGAPGHFNWCDPQIYYGEPFPDAVNVNGSFPQEILCGACVGKRFADMIYSKDLRFDDISIPMDADGFCTSWEF